VFCACDKFYNELIVNFTVLELLLEALSLLTMSMLRVIMVWQSTSALTRLKEKLGGFWLHMIQRWPTVHYYC
jgi:hypothetical protein